MKYSLLILLTVLLFVFNSKAQDEIIKEDFRDVEFRYTEITGIGYEEGCTRRDPSDIIKVDNKYYIYYTKVYGRAPGYWGTLWYAISTDEGNTWVEKGEVLGVGSKGSFDSQATFTPNILYANGKYWLFYTGVKPTPGNKDGEFENNSTTDITALGLAVSHSPDGPFVRYTEEPVLKISTEPGKFDSYRIDDAALLYRNGLYWLYHKGRSRLHGDQGPRYTRMGVAFSKKPEGPYEKIEEPLLADNHEVMIWPHRAGIATLASFSNTIEYAADGLDFTSKKLNAEVKKRPNAPGAYRPDLVNPVINGEGLDWGIGMVHNGPEAYLIRFELVKKELE